VGKLIVKSIKLKMKNEDLVNIIKYQKPQSSNINHKFRFKLFAFSFTPNKNGG